MCINCAKREKFFFAIFLTLVALIDLVLQMKCDPWTLDGKKAIGGPMDVCLFTKDDYGRLNHIISSYFFI